MTVGNFWTTDTVLYHLNKKGQPYTAKTKTGTNQGSSA